MNYRHSYHAGNHADVFKHAVVLRMAQLMQRKTAPFCYLDSHAGTALYDLQGEASGKTGEYLEGIARLWGRDDLPPLWAEYVASVAAQNADDTLRYYPGSPQLIAQGLREQDRMILSELPPADVMTALAELSKVHIDDKADLRSSRARKPRQSRSCDHV